MRSARLEMRDLTPQDYPAALLVYRQAPDFMVCLSGCAPEALTLALVAQEAAEAGAHGARYAGLFRRTDETLIGLAVFEPCGYRGERATAWIALLLLAEPYQRQGYGTEAARLLEEAIFADAKVRRIRLGVLVNNQGALRFWRRVGYRRRGGTVSSADGHDVYIMVRGRRLS